MGKLIVYRNKRKQSGKYVLDCYINGKIVFSLKEGEYKEVELENGIYTFSCIVADSFPSKKNKINIQNNNAKIEVSQGFSSPKIEVSYLSNNQMENDIAIEENNNQSTKFGNKINNNNKLTPFQIIIAIIMIIFGISLINTGNKKISGSGSNLNDEKFPYTIESQGIDEYGTYKISGTVTNKTGKEIDGLKIEFKCYDKSGDSIGNAEDYMERIVENEVWKYEAYNTTDASKIDNCEFIKVTPYTTIAEFH